KGQFSASADVGSKPKKGEPNRQPPIDPVLLALTLGATFVARCVCGDKEQLVPIIKAGIAHSGFAFIDVISPCVTFNDHEGSTRSYKHTREHAREVVHADLVEPRDEITVTAGHGDSVDVRLHDGSTVRLLKTAADYDATDRDAAYAYVRARQRAGEVPTGLLYIETGSRDMHDVENVINSPLAKVPFEQLCPGSAALAAFMDELR
ncbi:MAG: 2-oxoacid:ferredoxin oxidoreductase subunit beta, partial [Gemmatimonadota bacterium]